MEFIKVDKDCIDILLDILEMKDIKCKVCNVKIDKNNFGLIHKDIQACNEVFCLITAYEEVNGDE